MTKNEDNKINLDDLVNRLSFIIGQQTKSITLLELEIERLNKKLGGNAHALSATTTDSEGPDKSK